HPAEKAVLGFGLTLCAVCLPPWPGAPLVAAATLAVLLGPAGVPGRPRWRAVRIPRGVCVTGAGPRRVSVGGPGGLVAWAPDGPAHAGELLLRTASASLGVLLFAFTTPVSDVLPRLVRAGVPAPVVDVALVMYRIVFLLLDAQGKVRQAQAARLGATTRAAVWRSLAGLGATSFVRAFDRAQRLQSGLAGRGYDGTLRVLLPEAPVSRPFLAATGGLLAGLVALALVLERLLP
ncbi:cobalt ECF transporter T component CbiQ, partial [Streptomyces roseolus]|uniref:cobalt ECF transporter T component CbiQ n=1 Tax=Streptomyces roseolus TaxID=67358 RepID=UPI0036679799